MRQGSVTPEDNTPDTKARYSRLEWMGKRIRLTFEPHWPVPVGNYIYDGFDDAGVWVSHDHNGQRHIIWHDVAKIELKYGDDE
jgi:hypothetical protein